VFAIPLVTDASGSVFSFALTGFAYRIERGELVMPGNEEARVKFLEFQQFATQLVSHPNLLDVATQLEMTIKYYSERGKCETVPRE
jgi:hypothetical protein